MALLKLTMEPSMAHVTDGSFFEEIVRTFMELDSHPETDLPCTIYVPVHDKIGIGMPTRLGRLGRFRPCPNCASVAVPTTLTMPLLLRENVPTEIAEIMKLCDTPPLLRALYYRFSYHFCNHRIGRKLFMDFFYWPEPNENLGWVTMRYGVDSTVCKRYVDRPFIRRRVFLHGDVLLDTLSLFNCDVTDMAQLVCKSWRRSIDANASVLPLRQFTKVQVVTVAPELCRVICKPSSVAFTFRRHISFDGLQPFLQSALKRSRIALLKLKDNVDDYVRFRIFDALSASVVVEELRLDFRSQYRAETLTSLCTEALNVWKTTALGLYNPLHSQLIFGDALITRKLSRLEVSLPTMECRKELDALLFRNPQLEARLQLVSGHVHNSGGRPDCIEESFFRHYFESLVFRRISDNTFEGDFVRVLYIRSVFAFFRSNAEWDDWIQWTAAKPDDDTSFLQRRAGQAEDDGLTFLAYEAGSESRRYTVLWGWQEFFTNPGWTNWVNYYVITKLNEPGTGGDQRRHWTRFADWTIREHWKQRYDAEDYWPWNMQEKARLHWCHL